MPTPLDPLILDLVEFCARQPRAYAEVIEAWRTSCPRLTVWEDAVDRGLIAREPSPDGTTVVAVTPKGFDFLASADRIAHP